MEGFVMLINVQEKMAAVKTFDGSYSVVKIHDDDCPSIGDYLKGNLQVLGDQWIENLSSGKTFKAFIQDAKGIVAAKTKNMIGIARS